MVCCEGPDGHPTLFGDVATGLGGEVWKNRTRDGGCHKINNYLYTTTFIYKGLQQPETCAQTYNTHIPAVLTGIAVLCTLAPACPKVQSQAPFRPKPGP